MLGFGTIVNSVSIIAGGLLGHFTGKLFKQEQQDALNKACGICVLFIAIAGAMEGMLKIENQKIISGKSMLVVLCIAIGTVIGELLCIEKRFEQFGEWLKKKTGNSGDVGFVNAFVTASLTVSIGAMAIVGAIQDGLLNDYSTLAVKSVLDFIIIAVMTSSMGKGLGRMLMQTAENFAKDRNYKKLYLETHSSLKAAIRLYEKLGFKETDRPEFVLHSTMDRFYLKELS